MFGSFNRRCRDLTLGADTAFKMEGIVFFAMTFAAIWDFDGNAFS